MTLISKGIIKNNWAMVEVGVKSFFIVKFREESLWIAQKQRRHDRITPPVRKKVDQETWIAKSVHK